MSYPVSIIPYANMEPYRLLGPPPGCTFVAETPRRSTAALRAGRVLAAPMPVGDLPDNRDRIEPLGRFGIAAKGAVRSVLLFSRQPFESLTERTRLYLTDQSSSSVRLLYLLLGYQLGFDHLPRRISAPLEADAELLIGDEALRRANGRQDRLVIDLAERWARIHRLPFVFARWVARSDAPAAFLTAMRNWLDEFARRENELVAAAAEGQAGRLGLRRAEVLAYLQGMRRVLGRAELAGQDLFLAELARHGQTPLFESLRETQP